MPVHVGFYTELCDEWEEASPEQIAAYPSLVLNHRKCGGAILLYWYKDKPYDEARCQVCCASWRIQVIATKVNG